jgi:Tfp pilus assembly protein PilV
MTSGALRAQAGSSLLEVLIALALAAVAMTGAMVSQLQAAGIERTVAQRERALVIALSVAESMRDRVAGTHALSQWRARAALALPGAEISIVDHAPGIALAMVQWAASRPESRTSHFMWDGCGSSGLTAAGVACLCVPFVREAGRAP